VANIKQALIKKIIIIIIAHNTEPTTTHYIFKDPPIMIIPFKKGKSLKDMLVRAKIQMASKCFTPAEIVWPVIRPLLATL